MLADNGTAAGLLFGCNETVLNCSDAKDAARTIYPDLKQPFKYPGISCGGASGKVLRVFSGSACRLWRPDNAEGCWWCGALLCCAHCCVGPDTPPQ